MNASVSARDARAKDLAMMTPSTPAASPFSPASTNTAKAATVEANLRSAYRIEHQAAVANEARLANLAATAAAIRQATTEVPDPMSSLSTVAIAGALNSLPQALNMMRNIAMASASGTLTDADRQTLQDDYAQLAAKVVSSVGSTNAGAQTQSSTTHDGEREDNAGNTAGEDSDDQRSTLTRTVEIAKQTVRYEPVERTVTTQKQALVPDGHGPQKDPQVDFRTHELHVGTDSYEPVSVRQSMTHPTTPETFGRVETHTQTQHTFVTQAAQITQFVQVAQAEQVAPLNAVA
jgi:flagellin-like hook-associated protein FlgL